MKVSIYQTGWHGFNAFALESVSLRTVVVPELGAKLVSLLDKRNQIEWLAGPGDRPVKRVPYGAPFTEQDLSGWDEMFPTIVACTYPGPGERNGAPLPDHGEVWALPWAGERLDGGAITLSVKGKALPYRLTRRLEFSGPATMRMHYRLENLSQERLAYIWAAHPQFTCGSDVAVIFPEQVTEVVNTIPAEWGWGNPGTRWSWPEAIAPDGSRMQIDRVGPPELKRGRKFFALPGTRAAWAGLIRRPANDWLRMDWDPDSVPYLGLWVDEGALSHESVAAPEPTTGFYDSLEIAWKNREVTVAEPGAPRTWTLTVTLGTGEQPFPAG